NNFKLEVNVMLFKLMALLMLGVVYLVLFTTVFPIGSTKQKLIYAMSSLVMSALFMFIAPTLYA
uniref:hypothetical protein n=1 Tax=Vibrio cholerae TaxID=666 RepID=UPI000B6D7AB5